MEGGGEGGRHFTHICTRIIWPGFLYDGTRAKLPLWEKLTAEAAKLTLAEEVAKELTDQKTRRALQAKRSQRQNPLPHQKIKTVRARHDF